MQSENEQSSTRVRIGPPAPSSGPFYCPWCQRQIDDEHPVDHPNQHRDKAHHAYLIQEEFWPAGTAAHLFAEGVH